MKKSRAILSLVAAASLLMAAGVRAASAAAADESGIDAKKAAGTAAKRDNAGMAKLLTEFNVQDNGWTKGPTMDAIINTYERTHDPKYRTLIDQSFQYSRGWRSGDANTIYFDDMGWYANAWLRAYDVTGDGKFLVEAQAIFSDMTTAWDGTCGGGVYWNSDRKYKNAITNELFLLAASRLARRAPNGTGAGSYQDWALKEWDWFSKSGMINSQNLVNDGLEQSTCKNNNAATWSYNQGVILGGLVELWRISGDRGYLANAEGIAEATIAHMAYPDGVLRDACENGSDSCTGDALIFKGMFAQGLARLWNADRGNKPQYKTYLQTNAAQLWNKSRDASNGLGVVWEGPVGTPSASSQAAGELLLGEMALLKVGGETATPIVGGVGPGQPGPTLGTHVLHPQAAPNLALDDDQSSTAPGNRIQGYTTNGGNAQSWTLAKSNVMPAGNLQLSILGNFCLTASASTSGSPAVLQACDGSPAQAWRAIPVSGGFTFSPANNAELCLDLDHGTATDRTIVQVWTCNNGTAQTWSLD